jgi:group I intron endonuclease
MPETQCGIYEIKNIENNKVYIGQASDIYRRWRQHKHLLNCNQHANKHLQASWNKHGEHCFVFSILKTCDQADLGSLETAAIHEIPENLRYNSGESGPCPTLGIKHSDKTKKAMSYAKGGRPVLAENLSTFEKRNFAFLKEATDVLGLNYRHAWDCCAGKRPSVRGWKLQYTGECAPKILKEKNKITKTSRAIVGTCLTTGRELVFEKVADVRGMQFSRESVYKCLSGQMQKHKNHTWRYVDGLPHKNLSDEWCKKLTKPRNKGSAKSFPVIGTCIKTGQTTEYPYIAEAARAVGCQPSYISLCLSGRLKQAGGFLWHKK